MSQERGSRSEPWHREPTADEARIAVHIAAAVGGYLSQRISDCSETRALATVQTVCKASDHDRSKFDEVVGSRLGREIATYVYEHNLRKASGPQ